VTAEPAVVPRWEWRTFGRQFDATERLLADLAQPDGVRESDEMYLVSLPSNASVKLRDELVDVKRLERVDDAGLELWKPVLKAAFPLSMEQVTVVLTTLGVAVPGRPRGEYTREQFAAELIAADRDLLALPVHKRRAHYLVDSCMVEVTDITTGTRSIRTVAVESPDPDLVRSTVERLGLHGRPNVSVARGLKTLVGFGAHRNAVIDVGTNSVKFFLGEREPDGTTRTISDRAEVTRLGEGLDATGALSDDAITRTVIAIGAMCDEARREHAETIAIVGTAGLRSALNRARFDEALHARCARAIEIIGGEEEGRLAYLAATANLTGSYDRLVVFDSGGGSTQFTFGRGGRAEERFSLDIGAVRVAERFGLTDAVSRDALVSALDAIASELTPLRDRPVPDAIVAMGGTVTNLAAVKHGLVEYDPSVVNGTVLDLDEIDRQIERYRTRTADERREIAGLQPARGEVILGGACIVRTIITTLQRESLTVSDRGVRHGLFIERFT
jgi:exopolyphosphatase/guanosine-5'-triphosphate,3'-diphosphate pyrophosphatase